MTNSVPPFGSWPSPITADDLSGDLSLQGVAFAADGETVVWLEGRSGKNVLVAALPDDAPRDLTRAHDVRARVGYGGGDFAVHGDDVYFVARRTGRLWHLPLDEGAAEALTPALGVSAADPQVCGDWIAYVHHDDEGVDRIAVVPRSGGWPRVLAEGHDFYMQPRFSPDGTRFAFVAWDHPGMPWDGTTLYLGRFEDGVLSDVEAIAGGDEVAVFQPELLVDGTVLYISDETGWGQPWRYDPSTGTRTRLGEAGVEYGRPAWGQGMRAYVRMPGDGAIVCVRNEEGFDRLERIDLATGHRAPVRCAATNIDQIAASPLAERVAVVGSSERTPSRVTVIEVASGEARVVARASMERVPESDLAVGEAITWPTAGGEVAHGLFYRPAGPLAGDGLEGVPPLLVFVHGGPTSQTKARWDPRTQYFATRGYAVLWVNYRGSTGYGRAYQTRLRESWGVLDVEDCFSAVDHLASIGAIDADRAVIAGGSAGGYTVLQALIHPENRFAAGLDYYGVADLFTLARDTHKFEARYLDSLIGELPAEAERYRERSPVYHAGRIDKPVAVFQGADDKVVPQSQSDAIVAALAKNGIPHVYHVYEGEGHGFRKQETLRHWFEAMEGFLRDHVLAP